VIKLVLMLNYIKWVVNGSRNLLLEFWDPSISRERLKLETLNKPYRNPSLPQLTRLIMVNKIQPCAKILFKKIIDK